MQVQQLPIYQFLEGSGKSFVIPVYQRDYAWTKINCQKLWDDLIDLKNNGRKDHFLGTLVTIGSGFEEYTIIDGQQRLTTASILLIALQSYLKNKIDKNENENVLVHQILDFLVNKYSHDEAKRIRLKPNKQDQECFEKLFTDAKILDIDSNIINNYNFFYDKIASNILSPNEIFESFRKLKIVLIDLVRGQDDPQLIFESLNSTGVDLTAGDLIRNYILMDLEPLEQEKLYKDYWINIEKLTGDVAEFIRIYLIFKTKTSIKKDEVYTAFKKASLELFDKDKNLILKDLLFFAQIYSYLVQITNHPDSSINIELSRLNRLEFTVSHSFLLDVFNDYENQVLSGVVVLSILKTIESYAFRKIIVDSATVGLNKMFISLSREIKKENDWQQQYLEIFNYIILEKRISQRFPTDDEFKQALVYKEVYRFQTKNRNFLLESLENFNSAYPVNVDDLTIEHIMPQTLTQSWKDQLGLNYLEIHKKYLHTLGNLSLTGKNSELSNNSFEDKQRIDFQSSKLKLNFDLENLNSFNEQTILDRANSLATIAINIWSFPVTTYFKDVPEEQLYDLTSEDSFSGSKPFNLYLGDEKVVELKTWRDLLRITCGYFYNFSPTEFIEIQNGQEFKWYFGTSTHLV